MSEITIFPAGPRDAAMHETQYERLRAALTKEGHVVSVGQRDEARTGLEPVVVEIALHIGEILAADSLIRLVRLVRRFLRDLRKEHSSDEPRQVVIYGPRGQVLGTVELPVDTASEDGRSAE